MSKLGDTALKAPAVFGVGSLLAEGSPVYYDNLFTSQYVGRVSDLLAAQLRRSGLDELRLRALLLFAVFEAYRSEASEGEVLAKPLVLECGADEEKIAIGISFRRLLVKDPVTVEGLGERLASAVPRDTFEELLRELYLQCDRLVLRFAPDAGRFEAVAVLSLQGQPAAKPKPELVRVGSADSEVARANNGDTYVQLADLDYLAVLKEPTSVKVKSETPLGALIARVAKERERSEEPILVRGTAEPEQESLVVAGEGPSDPYQDKFVVTGAESAPVMDTERVRVYEDRIADLEARIAGMSQSAAEQKPASGGLTGILKKAWPFRSLKSDAAQEQAGAPAAFNEASAPVVTQASGPEPADENSPDAAGVLVREIQSGGFSRVVNRAQEQSPEIRAELTNQRAQVWMDGIMGEIVAEKSRLQDLAKQVSLSVRQKEHHFKTREHVLQEELRKKLEGIRQRDATISRLKEQLSEVNMTLERAKAGTKTTTDTGHYKHKYNLAQKMLLAAKEENTQLKTKVEDMRSQVLAAQTASKTQSVPQAEFAAFRIKHERVARQLEDLKRQNRQLSDKLAESKKDRTISGGNIEDLKRRLDAAIKLATTHSKETEQLKLQLEELKREEARLKSELVRLQKPGTGSRAA